MLNRKLNEVKDSLEFSNKSCEQLEQKSEELERNNTRLRKLCDVQHALLEQKSENLKDLQEEYTLLKQSHDQLKVQIENESDNFKQLPPSRSKSGSGDRLLDRSGVSDVDEVQRSLAELGEKVKNSTFQKEKLQKELEHVVNENQSLLKALEHADSEMVELQMKLRHFEDSSLDFIASSPKADNSSTTIPLTDDLSSPLASQSSHKPLKSPKSAGEHNMGALSLFSELDSQFSSLQRRYAQMVEECTCSASLIHKKWLSSTTGNLHANVQDNGEMMDTPLKELFDEVFATLKQTTLVADKLIERNK